MRKNPRSETVSTRLSGSEGYGEIIGVQREGGLQKFSHG